MIIKPVTDQTAWDQFVLSLAPNTFLQSWAWGELQQAVGEKVEYLGIFDGETQVGAALLITVQAKRGQHYLCPHGPLFVDQSLYATGLEALTKYVQSRASADSSVALRIAPLIETSPESTSLFARHGFRPAPLHVHAELTWVLDITPPAEKLLQGMRKTSRHAIKKAQEKGVQVEILDPQQIVERFMPLYQHTTARHQFTPFSKDYLTAQVQAFAKHLGVFGVVARYEHQDVAAAILMHFGDTVFYHHGASIAVPGNIPAPHLLQWAAIQEAKRRGAKGYNFWGIAPADDKKHPFAGITVFKTGFGGYAIDYLHAQDLPLSWKYWKLWLIESIRKKKRGF